MGEHPALAEYCVHASSVIMARARHSPLKGKTHLLDEVNTLSRHTDHTPITKRTGAHALKDTVDGRISMA